MQFILITLPLKSVGVIVNVLHSGSSGRVRALTAVIYFFGVKNKSSIKPLFIQVKNTKWVPAGFTQWIQPSDPISSGRETLLGASWYGNRT